MPCVWMSTFPSEENDGPAGNFPIIRQTSIEVTDPCKLKTVNKFLASDTVQISNIEISGLTILDQKYVHKQRKKLEEDKKAHREKSEEGTAGNFLRPP